MKISGAMLSQLMPPACIAKKNCMFIRLFSRYCDHRTNVARVWIYSQTTARTCNPYGPVISRRDSDRFRPDHLPLRLESGEVVTAKVTVLAATGTLEKNETLPQAQWNDAPAAWFQGTNSGS